MHPSFDGHFSVHPHPYHYQPEVFCPTNFLSQILSRQKLLSAISLTLPLLSKLSSVAAKQQQNQKKSLPSKEICCFRHHHTLLLPPAMDSASVHRRGCGTMAGAWGGWGKVRNSLGLGKSTRKKSKTISQWL